MKRIPNLLSMSRIVLCLPLLLVDAITLPFWILYLIAGLTDMLDGFLARRWGVVDDVTGFLLFIGMMAIGRSYFVPVVWMIACIALFAAIQEGYYIRSKWT